MKKILLFSCCTIAFSVYTLGQHNVLSVGSSSQLTIKSATLFSADSLVLTPSGDLTLSTNGILESPVPISGMPNNSIDRVYYLDNPIVYTGDIKIYYQLSELNGNTESLLQYYDSTRGNYWIFGSSSMDNPTNHYVQYTASARSFNGSTASDVGDVLVLKFISFTGELETDHTKLTWTVQQDGDPGNYNLESSTDGQSWQSVADIPVTPQAGQFMYEYTDPNVDFTTRLYRVRVTERSGGTSYSPIVQLSKDNLSNNMRVIAENGSMKVYFIGGNSTGIRVVNALGQTIWRDEVARSEYEVTSLSSGIYFVQYILSGVKKVKQVVIY